MSLLILKFANLSKIYRYKQQILQNINLYVFHKVEWIWLEIEWNSGKENTAGAKEDVGNIPEFKTSNKCTAVSFF